MQRRPQENSQIFSGILMLVIAWRIVTIIDGSVVAMVIAGYLALLGAVALTESFGRLISVRQPYPFTAVPPLWLIAWAALWLAVHLYGTPHLALGQDRVGCVYVGWNGAVRTPGSYCTLFRFFPSSPSPGGGTSRNSTREQNRN
jgi:hypothetical protein